MSSTDATTSEDALGRHRTLLFTVADEMLGSAADAEDVVQETWLRWAGGLGDRAQPMASSAAGPRIVSSRVDSVRPR